jgi:glucose-1-phosphate thymidylyltransferase
MGGRYCKVMQSMTTTATTTKLPAVVDSGGGSDSRVKGLILAGGKGSRLRPFTYTNAKQLVPIANKPVLFYAIEQLVEAGITDIGIVVGDTAEQVQSAVGDGDSFGASVSYIQQEAPLGIAHGVKIAREYLGGSRFVVYLGDNFVLGGINQYVEGFTGGAKGSRVLVHRVPDPQAFGVAEVTNGRITRVVEKPKQPKTDLAVVGVYMFEPAVFDVIETLKPSGRGELEITDAIQGLIDRGDEVSAEVLEGYWIDTGKMDDMLNANRLVLETLDGRVDGEVDGASKIEGAVIVEEGARVRSSVLRGPLIIGAGTEVARSELGPFTSIDAGCRIEDCRIADSIVMENAVIRGIHWPIVRSMIGRYVDLIGGHDGGAPHSLTLGDHSRIEVPEA